MPPEASEAPAREADVATPPPLVKCVVWDIDNTLLDGVYLESAAAPPAADQAMAATLADLGSRGILHAIASKNPPEAAEHAAKVTGARYGNFRSLATADVPGRAEAAELLMAAVLRAADDAGYTHLTGKTHARNLGMRALYRKFGFEATHLTMEWRPGEPGAGAGR